MPKKHPIKLVSHHFEFDLEIENRLNQIMATTQFAASTFIAAPLETVWSVLADYGRIDQFHPLVKRSKPTNDISGLGSTRHCVLLPMGEMNEEIVDWTEGMRYVSEVIGGKFLPPVRFMKGEVEVKETEKGCMVTFTFQYAMKFGPLGSFMNLFMKPQFKKGPTAYVEGLREYAEKKLVAA